MALDVATLREVLVDSHARVEHETFTLPPVFCFRHFGEVFQYSALEVVDLFEAEFEHQRRRFFAADAAGAEHRERPVS